MKDYDLFNTHQNIESSKPWADNLENGNRDYFVVEENENEDITTTDLFEETNDIDEDQEAESSENESDEQAEQDSKTENWFVDDYYAREIRSIPVLTAEEEAHYAILVKTGTPEEQKYARHQLITHNTRYVLKIAARYIGHGIEYDDLVQDGMLGLMRAVEKYDISLGYRFTTYATWWIRQAITRGIADNGRTIRMPVHLHEAARILKNAEAKMQQNNVPQADQLEWLIKETGFTKEKILVLQQTKQNVSSLDSLVMSESGGDGNSTLGDFVADTTAISPEENAEKNAMQEELFKCMKQCLTEREQEVINLRFGFNKSGVPMTLEDVGNVLGVTRERIRQIEAKALKKMKHPKYAKNLQTFL